MIVKTHLYGRDYNIREVVRIVNPKQQDLYMLHEIYPIDIYMSYDDKSDKPIRVMVFLRSETSEVYDLWKKHELEYRLPEMTGVKIDGRTGDDVLNEDSEE